MDRIQNKNYRIRTYQICEICLYCINYKMCILNNGIDKLGFGVNYYNPEKHMSKFILILGLIIFYQNC